ncbi:MAG: hypothetical protein NXY57DRAFT_1038677 [Lentinula lateritia]|uniref:Uncharacterized protein n=1 Tax=Lentinula lateritia TaxID=40482 RepID=A0ABQ8VGY0_9AGAR|nr:MAG: hypothetical protein NXY57DRAFT_1038677 [Lentinula lateritia]KAJ4494191.1 hypothetical protein C8R41DRAFT_866894 [Lentinula lateritia]
MSNFLNLVLFFQQNTLGSISNYRDEILACIGWDKGKDTYIMPSIQLDSRGYLDISMVTGYKDSGMLMINSNGMAGYGIASIYGVGLENQAKENMKAVIAKDQFERPPTRYHSKSSVSQSCPLAAGQDTTKPKDKSLPELTDSGVQPFLQWGSNHPRNLCKSCQKEVNCKDQLIVKTNYFNWRIERCKESNIGIRYLELKKNREATRIHRDEEKTLVKT